VDGFKPPALTSPWKVGFLVSLLLVAMAIGVGFFITRVFGLSWGWIEFAGGSWDAWTFHSDRFLREMGPLVMLVPVLSMVAYFLVTGAVRRYRAYLNSGADYFHLVQTLSTIEDISDEKHIKTLSEHTELRDFLLKIRDEVRERGQIVEEKEEMLAARAESLESGDAMAVESGVLVSAIMNGRDGFAGELTLTHPQLKEIDAAIRENLLTPAEDASASAEGEPERPQADEFGARYREVAGQFEACVEDIRREAVAFVDDASRLVSFGGASAVAGSALSGLDAVAHSLSELGEETRALAIQMAMKASSSGDTAVVEMAESLRGVAERFGGVSARWESEAVAVRDAAMPSPAPDAGQELAERAQTLARTVEALSRSVEQFREDVGAPAGGGPAEVHAATASPAGVPVGDVDVDGFERQSMEPVLAEPATGADSIPEVQQDPDPIGGMKSPAANSAEETNLFADIPGAPGVAGPGGADKAVVPDVPVGIEKAPQAAEPGAAGPAPRTEVVDSLFEEIAPKVEPAASPAGQASESPNAESPAADDGVVDLYALGAVDYEPQNAFHQV